MVVIEKTIAGIGIATIALCPAFGIDPNAFDHSMVFKPL